MAQFEIGDTVEVIDDALKGKLVALQTNKAVVLLEDGFEIEVFTDELVKITDTSLLHVSNQDVARILSEKTERKRKTSIKLKPKERSTAKMEVDLHIHQLTKSSKGMSNYDMLQLQLDAAKYKLEFAIKNRIQKVVFIHGVGAGVLKLELEYLFGRYDRIKFYDANYQRYGLGATEVYIFQNN